MQGFVVFDYQDRLKEAVDQLCAWVQSGQIKAREHILDGMGSAPSALQMLYRGENHGKLRIRID
jgi:NADPH-dependent curcumin reductase CurA